MYRAGLVFACLFATAGWATAASPNPEDLAIPPAVQEKAKELVQQLGSEEFAERENAQQELAEMGRLARPALLEGVNTDPDPEVRLRCAQLLPNATALDIKARLDTFLADTEGKYEHDLPGWKEFRAAVRGEWIMLGYTFAGDRSLDKPARQVFADLMSTPENRRLVVAIDGPESEFYQLVADRRVELYNRKYGRIVGITRRDPSLEDVTTLLFAESLLPTLIPRTTSISTLVTTSGFITAARATDEKAKAYRAIASAWFDSRNDPRDLYYGMTIATNLNLPEQTCRIAVRLLTAPGASASYRGRAAVNLINLGNETHLPALDKAMTDDGVIYTVRISTVKNGKAEVQTFGVQIRDVALAVSIVLTKQKLEDYGFVDRYANNSSYTNRPYAYTRYYFPDDAARKAAFAKWCKRRKANPDE
ncbi:MAG: hypothetical protein L0241_25145 [Planctomycetia bacterium]|nr:hypothetical protein [Planctomycetia bacterium]